MFQEYSRNTESHTWNIVKTKYEMAMLQDRTKDKDKKELVSKQGRKAHSQHTQK